MLMFDGASLDFISPDVAAGRLPNIGRIFDQGAVLHLATLRPTQAEPVWSAIATGRYPMYNGIRSAAMYRALGGTPIQLLPDYCFSQALVTFGFLTEEPQTATDLLARPIWNILSDRGARVGVIGWPLTQPAPRRQWLRRQRRVSSALGDRAEPRRHAGGVAAGSARRCARRRCRRPPTPIRWRSSRRWARRSRSTTTTCDPISAPVVADRVHLQLLNALDVNTPRFLAARFPGIDAVGHRFLRYADPSAFGDVSAEERQRFGRVLQQYYGFLDTLVGREIERLGPNDLLLVVSALRHGADVARQARARVHRRQPADQRHARTRRRMVSFLRLARRSRRAGRPRASVVDLAPTILYFLGLPVGRDMDGFARIDLFKPAFTSDKPVTYIPSVRPLKDGRRATITSVALEHDCPADVAGHGHGVFRVAGARQPPARVAQLDARLARQLSRARRHVALLGAAAGVAVSTVQRAVSRGEGGLRRVADAGRVADDAPRRALVHHQADCDGRADLRARLARHSAATWCRSASCNIRCWASPCWRWRSRRGGRSKKAFNGWPRALVFAGCSRSAKSFAYVLQAVQPGTGPLAGLVAPAGIVPVGKLLLRHRGRMADVARLRARRVGSQPPRVTGCQPRSAGRPGRPAPSRRSRSADRARQSPRRCRRFSGRCSRTAP